ncbi:hypothetical protein HFV01_17390 [Limnospira fusiformis SAG 85.79]|uniref:Uncharacterized protein n=1 Tax=Limnospira indica PCC 8005 TaxID=376219 RepID=A0A9P1KEG2_9CYAN|nr:hypothetical protein HFV01_17390 [Limnospira fusiformis SAG 85.79]CDM94395.1 hypothetical protein ARTHRO_12069 [Limnospira indica PCC 8005]
MSNAIHKAVVKNVSAWLEGEGCDQKLKPNCHGGDMPTGHGVDIDTAIIRSIVARTSSKTTCCIKL